MSSQPRSSSSSGGGGSGGGANKISRKNARNAEAARQGLTKPRRSYAERKGLDKKPAVPAWALAVVCFVVIGGVFFELARAFL
ncbi:unnamed protein product [Jaminaea pallidilutea]